MPVKVFDALFALQSAVIERSVSAVRSAVTAAGASKPETLNAPDVFVDAVRFTVTSPTTSSDPVAPLARVWIYASMLHAVFAAPDAHVIASLVARSVPPTPPQRMANVIVGVPVVESLPYARSRNTRPSLM